MNPLFEPDGRSPRRKQLPLSKRCRIENNEAWEPLFLAKLHRTAQSSGIEDSMPLVRCRIILLFAAKIERRTKLLV